MLEGGPVLDGAGVDLSRGAGEKGRWGADGLKLYRGKGVNLDTRLAHLREQFTSQLIALILDENFEHGIDTKADVFARHQMKLNTLATKFWLNRIFIGNSFNIPILLGILRIIARLNYFEIYPEGQTMAMAALSHKNVEVQECGVRAFESWQTVESLKVLENLKVATQWLQEYIDKVVLDLRKEYIL